MLWGLKFININVYNLPLIEYVMIEYHRLPGLPKQYLLEVHWYVIIS